MAVWKDRRGHRSEGSGGKVGMRRQTGFFNHGFNDSPRLWKFGDKPGRMHGGGTTEEKSVRRGGGGLRRASGVGPPVPVTLLGLASDGCAHVC